MSRTRSEGGATVVRLDAISRYRHNCRSFRVLKERKSRRPRLSVLPNDYLVNENGELVVNNYNHVPSVTMRWLLIPKQFFCIFNKADQHDDRRPRESDEEHNLEKPHANDCNLHAVDCSGFLMHFYKQTGDSQRDAMSLSVIRARLTVSDTARVDAMQ
jgi:hypothetical protein